MPKKLSQIITLFFLLPLFTVSARAEYKVALVLDKGGRDDKSFNAAAYKGATEAEKELGIFLKCVETTDDMAVESTFRSFAQKNFDLIIGIGFSQAEAIKHVAAQYPKAHFALVDAKVDLPNVRSVMFEEHQGSFLVGALAAMASKTGKIGFVGGMDVPLIRRFQMGYEAGAKHANPKIKLVTNYIGVTSEAWNNPAKGKELALSQYGMGVDVIFAAAGASNNGIFDAAEDKKHFAIGVDSNQNWVKPGRILTSMLKRVDVAVRKTIQDGKDGKFTGGEVRYGLNNFGIDYAVDQYNQALLTPAMKRKVEDMRIEILSGKIKVPDYYLKNAK